MTPDDPSATDPAEPRTGVEVSRLTGGRVRRVGPWAVGMSHDEPFAVSSRCRHQLGDLSQGSVDSDGCLVCPWHGARYDVSDGRMVQGPSGFLSCHGPTRGYRALVKAYARRLPLRRRPVRVRAGRAEVQD